MTINIATGERSLCRDNQIEITDTVESWERLSGIYSIPTEEVGLIDFNRSGVFLPNHEVVTNYRVRFKGNLIYPDGSSSWYALPVRKEGDTNFNITGNCLCLGGLAIGAVEELVLDTCESSYKRGPNLLNLNSRSRSNCGGCRACVHHYKNLYDETVIHDQDQLVAKGDLERFFDSSQNLDIDVSKLDQIAVVTGLFGSEEAVVEHMKLIAEVVRPRGFTGELMYFGCEVNSEGALDELAKLGNFALVYALDNFTKREKLLARTKSLLTIGDAKRTLDLAKERGILTTFAYIAGIDPITDMAEGFRELKDSVTRFPIVNIYQVQVAAQVKIMDEAAKKLGYYLQARNTIEGIMGDTPLRPKRWENYRPLWYRSFNGEILQDKPYGD
jgi:hypothetical protein